MIQILDFYADWCAPCKALSPLLDQLQEEYGDRIKVIKSNVEEDEDLALIHNVRNVPTMVIVKEGEVVARMSGALPKDKLKIWIETFV